MSNNKPELKEIKKDNTQEELIKKLQAENEELNKKLKYMPKPAPLPQNQIGLPKNMQDSNMKTVVRDMSNVIKEKMMQLEDLATAEVMLDNFVRVKNRLESIKKVTSAQNIKIQGHWKTIPPKMHIASLSSRKISNDESEITFGVYETDDKGNKKLFIHYTDVMERSGQMVRRENSAEYRIAYEVIETIKKGKPITREIRRIDRIQE